MTPASRPLSAGKASTPAAPSVSKTLAPGPTMVSGGAVRPRRPGCRRACSWRSGSRRARHRRTPGRSAAVAAPASSLRPVPIRPETTASRFLKLQSPSGPRRRACSVPAVTRLRHLGALPPDRSRATPASRRRPIRPTSGAAVDALLDEARAWPRTSPASTRARSRASTGRGCSRRWSGWPRISRARRAARSTSPTSSFAADTEDPAIGALLQRSSERATSIQTAPALLRARVGRDRRRARRGAARDRGPRLLPPPPADGAPLSPPPAERSRGADRLRALADGRRRLEPALRRAHLLDPGRAARRRRAGDARPGALRPLRPRSRACAAASPRP